MSISATQFRFCSGSRRSWLIAGLLVAIALLLICRNLPWHLDDYDQAKQAFVSYEMVKDGAWWFQHTPTGRVATKPPLAGWISASLALLTGGGAWDLAWRLPPLFAAFLILRALWKEGYRLGGELSAVVAVGAFALNLFAPRLATLVRTDMLLTLCIFAAGFLVYRKLQTRTPWETRDRFALFAVLLASMLIKGPIAYAFLLPGLVAFLWLERRSPDRHLAWSGWWSWFAPLALFGVWAGAGIWLSRDFYEQVVLNEFLGRFTVGEAARHHNSGPQYYFIQLLHRFFPWSFALIATVSVPDVRAKLRRDPALLWLACWAIGGLVFMSLVPSKRPDRIFPVVPPFALLLAGLIPLLPRLQWEKWPLAKIVTVVTSVALVFSASYAGYRVWEGYHTHQKTLVEFGHKVTETVPTNRLGVVSGKDEGMLLYTGKTRFTRRDEAAEAWRDGTVDALVVPKQDLGRKATDFPGSRIAFESVVAPEKNNPDGYALLVREQPK